MNRDSKIYIAGHAGMVGTALMKNLRSRGFTNLIYQSSSELDLRNQALVQEFFSAHKPEYVFLVAGKVGGVLANSTQRAEFLYDNLMIASNVIHHSFLNDATKLLYIASSSVYPRDAPQPLKESFLLTGELETTHEPYSIAKIAGIKLCQSYRAQYGCDFISVLPSNIYGPSDRFDVQSSQVIPALLRKFIDAKTTGGLTVWGTGNPLREFIHVDDVVDASVFLMEHYSGDEPVNLGTGDEISIRELVGLMQEIADYHGHIEWDGSKPDGAPRRLLDVSKLKSMGWYPKVQLRDGIRRLYERIQG